MAQPEASDPLVVAINLVVELLTVMLDPRIEG